MTATVNRDTGNITINNPTQQTFNIVNYTIGSVAGELDSSKWKTITHNTAGITQAGWAITAPTTPPDPPTAVSVTAITEAGPSANFVNADRSARPGQHLAPDADSGYFDFVSTG